MSHGIATISGNDVTLEPTGEVISWRLANELLADRMEALTPLVKAVGLYVDGAPFETHIKEIAAHLRKFAEVRR